MSNGQNFTGIKEKPKAREKSWPGWQNVGGATRGTYDSFNSKPEPNKLELVRAFDDIAYACASLIAQTVATTPLKLFVRTDEGQPRPKCGTRPVGRKTLVHLGRAKNLSRGTLVEEVTSHPALDLLCKANPYHNRMDLFELTELSLEVTGNAYWLMKFDAYALPQEVYLLPSQDVEPIRDGDLIIRGWKFGQGDEQVEYTPNEIIHFKMPSLLDPYGEGMAPLRAAWQRVQIGMKELGFIDSTLENMGRPDLVISPNEPISPFEAERLAKDWTQRYRGQGNGGPFVADGPLTVTPINYSPRDMWELAVYKEIKTAICNCFHFPPDLLEIGEANRSTAEAALYALAVHCIKPRMCRLVHKLNERLLCFYGEDRLFFEADEVVPDDKQFELQEMQVLLNTGCVTRDEVRHKYGYAPTDWAAEPLLPPGASPALAPVEDREGDYEEPAPAPLDRSTQAPAIAALQSSYYAGQLPREACIANARLLFGFTPEEAEALFPAVQPVSLIPHEAPQESPPEQAPPPPPPEKSVKKKSPRRKALRRKSPDKFAVALQKFFKHQAKAVVEKVKGLDEVQTKNLPSDWLDLKHWTDEMFRAMRPVVAVYYDYSAKETVSRIGGSAELFATVQPKLNEGVDGATLLFCAETNATTKLELSEALTKLREELTQGLIEGDVKNEMMKRVQTVFEGAENARAWRIAVTEASRAQHAAQEITAIGSGVVSGKRWVLSDEACPLCKPLAGKVVPLGHNFTTAEGGGPYSDIPYPPLHPHCRCDMIEVVEGVNDD